MGVARELLKTVYEARGVNLHCRGNRIRSRPMPLSWLRRKFQNFELYTVDVVLGRRADTGAAIFGALLQMLSWLFNCGVQLRL